MPAKTSKPKSITHLTAPGDHPVGGGLYLIIKATGAKSWIYRYRMNDKRRKIGLGSLDNVNVTAARQLAAEAGVLVGKGIDPLEARREAALRERHAPSDALFDAPPIPTFGPFAKELLDDWEAPWTSEWTRALYERMIRLHARALHDKPLDQIGVDDVLGVLRSLMKDHEYTAMRTRGFIEQVLDAAKVKKLRSGENPAAWKGNLAHILKKKGIEPKPQPSLPYGELPALMAKLDGMESTKARLLEFQILTAARPSEARAARWSEIDREARLWTVPPERMKERRIHFVPLTPRMLEVLDRVVVTNGDFVFRSPRRMVTPISKQSYHDFWTAMAEPDDYVLHGFRASFSSWAKDKTRIASEIKEAALAHLSGDKVERTYARSEALERRLELMMLWEECLSSDLPRRIADQRVQVNSPHHGQAVEIERRELAAIDHGVELRPADTQQVADLPNPVSLPLRTPRRFTPTRHLGLVARKSRITGSNPTQLSDHVLCTRRSMTRG